MLNIKTMLLVGLFLFVIMSLVGAGVIKKCIYTIYDQKQTIKHLESVLSDFGKLNDKLHNLAHKAVQSDEVQKIIIRNKALEKKNKSLQYTYNTLRKAHSDLLLNKIS